MTLFFLDEISSFKMKLETDYVVLKPDVSKEEFWEITNEASNFELIEGVLIIHSPATREHEDIFKYLLQIIAFHLQETGKGTILG